jgi:hypothetical protein
MTLNYPFRALLAVAAVIMGFFALAPSAWAAPDDVPDQGTVQTNGTVYAVLTMGNRVYLGGSFTEVDGERRDHLAAIDATTGELTSWAPRANGTVRALAGSRKDGRVYAGGEFTDVDGKSRGHLVALSAARGGRVISDWAPRTDTTVHTLAVSGKRLYIGGAFSRVNGQPRTRLALLNRATGKLNTTWAPTADGTVRELSPSKDGTSIYAGGDFTSISGESRPYLAALDPASSSPKDWQPSTAPNGPVFDLALSGNRLYSAEGGLGGQAAAYDIATGNRAWGQLADSDVQAVTVLGDKVYVGGHFTGIAGQTRDIFAALDAATGELDQQWAPNDATPEYPGVWVLRADPARERIYAGGAFTSVSGQPHQGFAQFS